MGTDLPRRATPRIALCTWGFPEFTVSLARSLANSCEVTVLLPEHMRRFAADLTSVVAFPYRLENSTLSKFFACSRLARLLRQLKPDLIQLQGWSPLLTPFLPVFPRCPIVYSWHDPVAHAGDESWAMDVTQKLLISRSERVVLLSEAMKSTAAQVFPRARPKMTVIPHGLFDFYLLGAEQCPAALQADEPFILCFGRIAPYKGVEDLCDAFAATSLPSRYKLVVAGRQNYPLSIPSEHRQSVIFLNEYIRDDVVRYLFRHCSIVVLPYREATQSGVLMLAYAFGRPVLCTNVGGMPEMVQDGVTAITVAPRAPRLLAETLEAALRDPKSLERIGSQGLAFASENFSWDRIAGKTFALYNEVLSRPHHG